MNMEYNLGQFLKNRYMNENEFVNSSYLHKEVYIRSSDSERCLQSAASQLAGMYPPTGRQVLRPDGTVCPRLGELWEEKKEEEIYKKKQAQYAKFLEFLTVKTGMQVTFDNVGHIANDFKCQIAEGFSIPGWAKNSTVWSQLNELSDWLFLNSFSGSDEIGRLLGGTLLGIINENMDQYRSGKSLASLFKLNVFSGHDSSLLSLTAALDIYLTYSPPFASCIVVELYNNSKREYFVKMFYRNDSTVAAYPLKLKNCDYSCPLDEFIRLSKNRVAVDRSYECSLVENSMFTVHNLKIMSLTFACCTGLLLVAFIVLIRRRYKSRRKYVTVPSF